MKVDYLTQKRLFAADLQERIKTKPATGTPLEQILRMARGSSHDLILVNDTRKNRVHTCSAGQHRRERGAV
jgi:hypothetical protein